MESRKEQEIKHYDTGSQEWLRDPTSFKEYKPLALASYRFCYALLRKHANNARVLDYGCGNGVHLVYLASSAKSVVGIDLSEKSLEIAHRRIGTIAEKEKITLQVMDCEHLEFPPNSFDVVFDGGTFSSLDFETSMKEISRVLTPDGTVIGIETFGHNPLTNLKRRLNKKRGVRTAWAAEHILTEKKLNRRVNFCRKPPTVPLQHNGAVRA